ncbi:MAG: cell division protein FtsQ/DivIB, partial [Gammaproteobacteria bacterium]
AAIVIEVRTARPPHLLISERGKILAWATPGLRIDSTAVREGLALLPRLPGGLRREIAHLQISRDREVFIYLRDGLELRGGPLRGVARRLEAAPEVLRRLRAEGAILEYVDFSLADQVVIKPRAAP